MRGWLLSERFVEPGGATQPSSTREIGEAPLVLWFLFSPKARARRAAYPAANVTGKLATVLQFAAVGSVLEPPCTARSRRFRIGGAS